MVDIRHLLPFCLVVICPLFEELSFSEFSITCEMQMLKAEKASFFCIWILHSNTVDWTRGAGFAFRFSFRKQSQRGNLEKLEKILSLDFQD